MEGYGGKEAYYPILEAIGQLCQGSVGEPVVQILAKQAPTWLVQYPALVKREQRETLQREILGATRDRMLREIGEALETITAQTPLLLVLEDLQWVDPSTIDLVSSLARRRGPAKLMLVGTYRPVDVAVAEHPIKTVKQDLLVHNLCHEVRLHPLGETEVAQYLATESSKPSLPAGLAALVHRRSEGNPLFMVAALDHMTQRGFISRENGQWRLNLPLDQIDLEIPESLRQMIEAQIDRLSSEEQRALEVASVASVGPSRFAVISRVAIANLEPEAFEEICEALSGRHCILRSAAQEKFPDGTFCACYEFVHTMYREVCYQRLSPGRRANLHRRVGEWIETYWKLLNEVAGWLAEHFEKCGEWTRAVNYLQLAADTASRRFEPDQTAQILEHALALIERVPESDRATSKTQILGKLANTYVASADTRAIQIYAALAAHAAHHGLTDTEIRALIGLAFPLSWLSSSRCLQVVQRALELSATQQDPLIQASTRISCHFWRVAAVCWKAQDLVEWEQTIAEVRRSGNRNLLACHLIHYSFIQWCSSEYAAAQKTVSEGLAILDDECEQNIFLSTAYHLGQYMLPLTLVTLGEWSGALKEIKAATAIMEKNGDYHGAQRLKLYRAWIHLLAMDFKGTLSICDDAVCVQNEVASPGARSPSLFPTESHICSVLSGSAEVALGNDRRGFEHLQAARNGMAREMALCDWYWQMVLESSLTELWLARGGLSQAGPQADRFLQATSATAEHAWQALAWEGSARVASAQHDLKRAQENIEQALSTMECFDLPLAAWRVYATAAELYKERDENELAQQHRDLSCASILKLAGSLSADEPLQKTFLSAQSVRKVLRDHDPTNAHAGAA